jgi:hypothetical protein
MERDDFPSLKKERLARLTLPFVMTLDHTHLQERDLGFDHRIGHFRPLRGYPETFFALLQGD